MSLGCSPLHVAAQAGNTECVKRILQHKVHVGSKDGRKMTALHHAGLCSFKILLEKALDLLDVLIFIIVAGKGRTFLFTGLRYLFLLLSTFFLLLQLQKDMLSVLNYY